MFDSFFRQRRYENAHFNFTNLFMWRHAYNIRWTVIDQHLCIKACFGTYNFALQPFGGDDGVEDVLAQMEGYFAANGWPFILGDVEKFMLDILENWRPGYFTFTADRDNFDYVYNRQDLAELKGRKYHGKKNHINSFIRMYPDYQYYPLTDEWVGHCIINIFEWCAQKGCDEDPMLLNEKQAIIEVLQNYQALNLTGALITVNNKVEAFTFGEQLNDDTAVIHVEKASPDIRGIYPLINQKFCRHAWQSVSYINREEDMGVPGLRKAKESYYPAKMTEKYTVKIK
ncbi:DUF2156 domain-containing protein [Methylomusa anaerophila]|uniref:DUF2156 domain-containing protein n=1 Tax=Methylomusa anaerophila TaxID=1930071 RepID=UPI0022B299E3|nr:phosphatidylglycerol lysyltransferase domain-containing protein [Methylomusa anaerophila]